MAEFKADVLVLGAGMVGVSAALHLQQRGRDVILVDRHELAGEETSFGNAGLIECASVFPYMFPRNFGQILSICDESLTANALQPFRFAEFSAVAIALLPGLLAGSCAAQRDGRIAPDPAQPGRAWGADREAAVPELLRRSGWIKLFRSDATLANAVREFERARPYGVAGEVLDGKAIAAREPNLTGTFAGAVYFPAPGFVPDPGALAKAYAALFKRKGGRFCRRRRANARAKVPADGASADPMARRAHAKRWWRWDRGPIWCFVRSDIPFRSASSAVTICIWRRAATPCSTIPSRFRSRLSAGADEPRHPSYHRRGVCPPRWRRRHRSRSSGRCHGHAPCFHWERRSMQNPGWAHGPVCPIWCR